MGSERAANSRISSAESGYLEAHFRVAPDSEVECVLFESGSSGTDVCQRIVSDGTCKAAVCVDGDRKIVNGGVQNRCVCPLFDAHDCIVKIESFDEHEMNVSVSTTDRDVLAAFVTSLREVDAVVRLQRITHANATDESNSIEISLDSFTEKQREAVRAAVEGGYYETPRRTDLSGLCEEIDVSRSAISQRLNAVERKLVEELFRVTEEPPSKS